MTETKDWTQRLHDYGTKAQENAKKVVERLLTKKDSEKAKQAAFLADLKACADESMALMADKRYLRQVKWLTELRLGYSRTLEQTDPAQIAKIARIQGKIENLDALLNRPKSAVKEYEAMSKELSK
jgi:Na+/phosphate symporter